MRIVGIDPGWSGGVATLNERGEVEVVASFTKMTEKDILRAMLMACEGADVVYIEKVHAMPGQGVTSMFKFGQIYGMLRMIVLAMSVPMHDVTPQTWQKKLSCRTGGDKNVTKSLAQQWWPDTKITHGNADALLIAEYGRLVQMGNPIVFME